MPTMRVCKNTGALIFSPTKAEKEVTDIKEQLREELSDIKKIKKDISKELKKLKKAQEAKK